MRKVKRIVKYVRGTQNYGTVLVKDVNEWKQIEMFCDSDWASCPRTRRSTSGLVAKVGANVIATWSKTQATVAFSSGEAEFVAIHQGCLEAMAIRSLVYDMTGRMLKIVIHTDSTAARAMTMRQGPGRVKHIDLKLLFAQELVMKRIMEVRKIGTLDNPADTLTKAVDQTTLTNLLRKIGVKECDDYSSEIGAVNKAGYMMMDKTMILNGVKFMVMNQVIGKAAASAGDEDQDGDDDYFLLKLCIAVIIFWELLKFVMRRVVRLVVRTADGDTTETTSKATQTGSVVPESTATSSSTAAATATTRRRNAKEVYAISLEHAVHYDKKCPHIAAKTLHTMKMCKDCQRLEPVTTGFEAMMR